MGGNIKGNFLKAKSGRIATWFSALLDGSEGALHAAYELLQAICRSRDIALLIQQERRGLAQIKT